MLSTITISNGIVDNNQSLRGANGVAIQGTTVSVDSVNFSNGNIYIDVEDVQNTIEGGLLYIRATSASLNNNSFKDSLAQSGAFYFQAMSDSTLSISNSAFARNVAAFSSVNSQGGAIYIKTEYAQSL